MTEASLSSSSALATTSQVIDAQGDYLTTSVTPDSTAPLTLAADSYPCQNVGYHATVRWNTIIGTSWTWRTHFGVYVCHNKVQHVNDLSAQVMDIIPTWSYGGVVGKRWSSAYPLPYANVQSYIQGSFSLYDKIVYQRLPWAKITIGGNGGLWARSTGIS